MISGPRASRMHWLWFAMMPMFRSLTEMRMRGSSYARTTLERAVRGAVVDDEELERRVRLRKSRLERFADPAGAVVGRQADGDERLGRQDLTRFGAGVRRGAL